MMHFRPSCPSESARARVRQWDRARRREPREAMLPGRARGHHTALACTGRVPFVRLCTLVELGHERGAGRGALGRTTAGRLLHSWPTPVPE